MKIVPSSIQLYFDSIKDFLHRNPIILNFNIVRERIANTEGFIEINVIFPRGYRFSFFEYYRVSEGVTKYRYQLLDRDDKSIVRWDNAPHHPELDEFPHHQHIGEKVQTCKQYSFYQIFNQLNEFLV